MTKKQARELGANHGRNAGSWVLDGNSSQAAAAKILQGYDDGDPEIMDMCPSPLSGEWAGNLLPADFNYTATLMDEYEEHFTEAYWTEVIRAARHLVQS